MSSRLKIKIRNLAYFPLHLVNYPFTRRKAKVFCLSMQRTGTTSVGEFLKAHGYRTARESDGVYYNWNYYWQKGAYEKIFSSLAFNSFQAYEDAPWWFPDFYQEVYKRFPDARFILLSRDSKKWFRSMISLKGGKTLGNTRRHCMIYERMDEFNEKLANDPDFSPTENEKDELLRLDHMEEHYVRIYEEYNKKVEAFFRKENPAALITARLEDPEKWQKIGKFLGLDIPEGYEIHANKSLKK